MYEGGGRGMLDYYGSARGGNGDYDSMRPQRRLPLKRRSGQWVDGLQDALGFAGFVPIVGSFADIANSGISALRGNWADAGLNAVAAIPGIGDVAAIPKGMGAAGRMARRLPFLRGM